MPSLEVMVEVKKIMDAQLIPTKNRLVWREVCILCGGDMIGDGYNTPIHCERVDIIGECYEPDCSPIYCDGSD